jgi:dynein assembly factor with WDR repeat domains 1
MSLEDHTEEISNAIFEFSGEYAATSSLDKTVRLWDLRQGSCLRCFDDHSDEVLDISFNPTGTLLASASADG